MADEAALIVTAQIARYEEEFAKLPVFTRDQARKAAEQFYRQQVIGQTKAALVAEQNAAKAAEAWKTQMAKAFENAASAGERQAARAQAAWEEAARESEKSGQAQTRAIKKIGAGFGASFINDIDDLAEGFGALGTKATIAGVAVAGILTQGAGIAKVAEWTWGLAEATAQATLQTQEIEDRLRALSSIPEFRPMDDSLADDVAVASAAFEGLGEATDKLIATFGAGWSPTVAAVLQDLQELVLFAVDVERAFSDMQNAGKSWREALVDISVAYDRVDERAKALTLINLGQQAVARGAKEAEQATREWERSQVAAERAAKEAAQDAREAERKAEQAQRERARRAEEARRAYERQLDAIRRLYDLQSDAESDIQDDATKAQIAYEERLAAAERAYQASERDASAAAAKTEAERLALERYTRDYAAANQERAKLYAEDAAAAEEAAQRKADAEFAAAEKIRQVMAQLAQDRRDEHAEMIGMFDQLAGAALGMLRQVFAEEERTHEAAVERIRDRLKNDEDLTAGERKGLQARLAQSKRAALAAWRQERATTVASVLLSEIAAIAKAVAAAPPPANLPIIAAQSALAAAQVFAATRSEPPRLHSGGTGASAHLAPDEVPATLRRPELVVNERGSQRHRAELDELNRTGHLPTRSSNVTNVFLNDRLLATVFGRALEVPGPAQRLIEERRLPPGSAPAYPR
jgi:hypothetical protein